MKNFEVPLHRVTNDDDLLTHGLLTARLVMDALREDEYFNEAPQTDPQTIRGEEFFLRLDGPSLNERLENANTDYEVGKMPKAYDVALGLAAGGQFDDARRLMRELLKAGRAHERVGDCNDFFEDFDKRKELYEELAELEGKKRKQEVLNELWEDD